MASLMATVSWHQAYPIGQWFSTRGNFCPLQRGRGSDHGEFWLSQLQVLVAHGRQRPGVLLNILKCTRQPPTTANYSFQRSVMPRLGNCRILLPYNPKMTHQESKKVELSIVIIIQENEFSSLWFIKCFNEFFSLNSKFSIYCISHQD